MATTNSGAKFKIDSSLSADGGYDASASSTLDLQLEASPALDVTSCRYSCYMRSDGASAPTFTNSGIASPPTSVVQVTLGAGAHSYAIRCDTNGGNAVVGPDGKEDWSVNSSIRIVSVRDANGLRAILVGERFEYDPVYGWTNAINEMRAAIAAAAATPYASLPEAITIGGGAVGASTEFSPGNHAHPVTVGTPTSITIGATAAAGGGTALASAAHKHALPAPTVVNDVTISASSLGASTKVAREDHEHRLTFAVTNAVLSTADDPVVVNGQNVVAGAFITAAANPATTGLLRGAHNSTLVAGRDGGNTDDVPIVRWGVDATDTLTIGEDTYSAINLRVASGRDAKLYHDGQLLYTFGQAVISAGEANTFILTQDTGAGAGSALTIRAQSGASTFNGGDLVLSGGIHGTGGTPGNVILLVPRNGAVSGNVQFISNASDEFLSATYNHVSSTTTVTAAPDRMVLDTKELALDASNIALFGTSGSYGSGGGVVQIKNATTEPTGDSSGGPWVWAFGNELKAKSKVFVRLVPELQSGTGGEDLRGPDKLTARVNTSDATVTTLLTFAAPDNAVAFLKATVVAWTSDGGLAAVYEIRAGVKRFAAGAATLIGSVDVFAREDSAGLDATIDVTGNNARIRVTGIVAVTYKWFGVLEATVMQPS